MARDPRKRQKKLARRAANRKEKQQKLVRRANISVAEQLQKAATAPILRAWMARSLDDHGIGSVGLSRQMSNGQVAFASFMVDRYCLGVKDAFGLILSRPEYHDRIEIEMESQEPTRTVAPEKARKFVEAAVAYARSLGLAPHPDYDEAMVLFGDIDPAQCSETFEFGDGGRPHFIAGPYDTPARCQRIVAALTKACGPAGFSFVQPVFAADEFDDEEFDDDDIIELPPGDWRVS